MAKDSILVGAVNASGVKVGGTEPTLGTSDKGGEDRYAKRTKSPNAQTEVLRVDYDRIKR